MVVSIIIASVLAVVFMGARLSKLTKTSKGDVVVTFFKTLASLGFVSIAIAAFYTQPVHRSAIFVLLGLVVCLIGDIFMYQKFVYSKQLEEETYLIGGMTSFGIGHIMYFIGVLLYFGSAGLSWANIGICIAVAAVCAFATIFGGGKLFNANFDKMIIPTIIYLFIVLFTTCIGITLWVTVKASAPKIPLFSMGLILFLLSDLALGMGLFIKRKNDTFMLLANNILYYIAQILIATFVFYMTISA